MKRKLKSIVATLLCILSVCSFGLVGCGGEETEILLPHYSYGEEQLDGIYNTDLFYRNEITVKMGDPTSIYIEEGEWEGWVYSTGTTANNGYIAYRTKDFVNWESAGQIFTRSEDNFGAKDFWAPQYLWDPNAKYEDYGYEVEEGEDGTGLYFLFYSARTATDREPFNFQDDRVYNDIYPNLCYVGVAISKSPAGPFKEFVGTNADGLEMDAEVPLFNLEYTSPVWGKYNLDENAQTGQEIYKAARSFIDACGYIDPVTGDKYLYLCRSRNVDADNEVWAVKMKDWVTPDYSTVTRLTSFWYTTTDRTERYNFGYHQIMNIDEGPYVIYNETNQKYYLCFSGGGGTDSKLYCTKQAIGDSPLGPFTKIQPNKGGILITSGLETDMYAAGHNSLLEIGDELYIVYHTYPVNPITNAIESRGQAFNKVEWMENEDGVLIMHSNGPNKTVTPLPSYYSGYKNIAPLAKVQATNGVNGTSASYLNDGLIKYQEMEYFDDNVKEFQAKGNTQITLSFDNYVTVRSILVYNSFVYESIFEEIEKIEFSYKKDNGIKGTAVIKNVKFDLEGHLTPLTMFLTPEEIASMSQKDLEEYYFIRPGSAAIAEFDEIKVNKIVITINKPKNKRVLAISDVFVMGKTE